MPRASSRKVIQPQFRYVLQCSAGKVDALFSQIAIVFFDATGAKFIRSKLSFLGVVWDRLFGDVDQIDCWNIRLDEFDPPFDHGLGHVGTGLARSGSVRIGGG